MDPKEILSSPLHEYQEQTYRSHDIICKTIDRTMQNIHEIFSEQNVNEMPSDNLEKEHKKIIRAFYQDIMHYKKRVNK